VIETTFRRSDPAFLHGSPVLAMQKVDGPVHPKDSSKFVVYGGSRLKCVERSAQDAALSKLPRS